VRVSPIAIVSGCPGTGAIITRPRGTQVVDRSPVKVLHVVGARPNFMKVAPVMRAMAAREGHFEQRLVHTGQHYDEAMSQVFFDELGIAAPDDNLEVGSGSHAAQTAEILVRFEPVLLAAPSRLAGGRGRRTRPWRRRSWPRSWASDRARRGGAALPSIAACPRRSIGW
jgi:hypothetical protein